MKKLSLLLAVILSLSIAATGCKDDNISQDPIETTGISLPEPETTAPFETEETTVETTEETTAATTEATTTAATTKATTAATTKATSATTAVATTVEATTVAATTVTTPKASNVDSSKAGKYVYNTLSKDEQALYDEILSAVKDFKTEVTLSKTYDGNMITKVYQDVYFQEPSVFWFRGENKTFSTTDKITLSYWCSKANADVYQQNIDAAVNKILAKIPNGASDIQKLKVIHDSICLTATFQKDTNFNTTTIYGPLVAGPTQCEGYAKIVSYLCSKVGIESVRITGYNDKGLTHAWNKVNVGGKWYNFDTTWDDPQGNTNPNYFTYNYFLVPDSQINNLSHFPDTSFTAPKANSLDANYHVVNSMYATSKDQAVKILKEQLINAAKTKAPIASVKCSSKAVYDELCSYLVSQAGIYNVIDDANKTAANKVNKDTSTFARDEKLYVFNIKPKY